MNSHILKYIGICWELNALVPEDNEITRDKFANEQSQSMFEEHMADGANNSMASEGELSNNTSPSLLSLIDNLRTSIQ